MNPRVLSVWAGQCVPWRHVIEWGERWLVGDGSSTTISNLSPRRQSFPIASSSIFYSPITPLFIQWIILVNGFYHEILIPELISHGYKIAAMLTESHTREDRAVWIKTYTHLTNTTDRCQKHRSVIGFDEIPVFMTQSVNDGHPKIHVSRFTAEWMSVGGGLADILTTCDFNQKTNRRPTTTRVLSTLSLHHIAEGHRSHLSQPLLSLVALYSHTLIIHMTYWLTDYAHVGLL